MNAINEQLIEVKLGDAFYDPEGNCTYLVVNVYSVGGKEPDELRFLMEGDWLERLDHVSALLKHGPFAGCPVDDVWGTEYVSQLVNALCVAGLGAIADYGVPLFHSADPTPVEPSAQSASQEDLGPLSDFEL